MEIQGFAKTEKQKRITENLPWFDIRIGIHTGPLVAGIVGVKNSLMTFGVIPLILLPE